jgi:hypothetical protein
LVVVRDWGWTWLDAEGIFKEVGDLRHLASHCLSLGLNRLHPLFYCLQPHGHLTGGGGPELPPDGKVFGLYNLLVIRVSVDNKIMVSLLLLLIIRVSVDNKIMISLLLLLLIGTSPWN